MGGVFMRVGLLFAVAVSAVGGLLLASGCGEEVDPEAICYSDAACRRPASTSARLAAQARHLLNAVSVPGVLTADRIDPADRGRAVAARSVQGLADRAGVVLARRRRRLVSPCPFARLAAHARHLLEAIRVPGIVAAEWVDAADLGHAAVAGGVERFAFQADVVRAR